MDLSVYLKLFTNAVVWALLAVAIFSYGKLLSLLFFIKPNKAWLMRCNYWIAALKTMLAALPLLGLLGTISGLLSTFNFMSLNNGLDMQEMVSGGIASAMYTTQLGLVFVVPGVLLHTLLKSKVAAWQVEAVCVR
ncbi:MotA/TolQ/ExbB proton channel family protein [Pseudoalteromonas sp. T1lg24]|uniref:MotA/TolQ/ExbB proton channel family protein n=1 Tax=Pseudoalteromonas sp. T1lg24 TaxID=2077099 RepID=UPI000CF6B425|nr:MotA/TolQ/ExbB proton channel family protein [Pseudoalteromonas sp. T1lg24]